MTSLKATLNAAGINLARGVTSSLQTYPTSVRELIRVLKLPPPTWTQVEPYDDDYDDYLFEFEEKGPQGIVFAYANNWFLSTERNIYRYTIAGKDPFRPNVFRRRSSAHLSDLVEAAKLPLRRHEHIGDLSYSQGIVFAPIQNSLPNKPHLIFGISEDLKLIAWAELEPNSSDAFCAIHPWNGLLYCMGSEDKLLHDNMQAYDVSEFFRLHQEPGIWRRKVRMPRVPKADIRLRTPTGKPDRYWAQGAAFSQNGRLYVSRSVARSSGGPWDNRLYVYSALTGKRFGDYKEYDFDSPSGWDEIEGITIHQPSGVLYVVVANTQHFGTDDFDLYTVRFRNLYANAV